MIKIKLLMIAILLLSVVIGRAQNELWLTNGKKIEIGKYNLEKKGVVAYKTLKGKLKAIDKGDVFSIIENKSNEVVVYQPDTSYSEAFNLHQMRAFVKGQYDANQNFKSPLSTIGGIVVAGASAVVINPLYVIVVSGVYCTGVGVTKPCKKKIIVPKAYETNDHYLLGYKKVAKSKRIKNAILGSVIGIGAGIITFAAINN